MSKITIEEFNDKYPNFRDIINDQQEAAEFDLDLQSMSKEEVIDRLESMLDTMVGQEIWLLDCPMIIWAIRYLKNDENYSFENVFK